MREKFRWGSVIWEGLLLSYKREFKEIKKQRVRNQRIEST
jgi:hypothetical protein